MDTDYMLDGVTDTDSGWYDEFEWSDSLSYLAQLFSFLGSNGGFISWT
jgi:hypothetical protein